MNDSALAVFPRLRTPRLLLRPFSDADVDLVFAFNADPVALRHVPRDPFTSVEQARIFARLSD